MNQSLLKMVLRYDQNTGIFTWKTRDTSLFLNCKYPDIYYKSWNCRFANKSAGTIVYHDEGDLKYLSISITTNGKGKIYRAHKLAWLYAHGEIPKAIDHIDHNGLNNSISNLRIASQLTNSRNQSMDVRNKGGFTGVRFKSGRWKVSIVVLGKNIYGGRFLNKKDAINKRIKLNNKYKFHALHGKRRGDNGNI